MNTQIRKFYDIDSIGNVGTTTPKEVKTAEEMLKPFIKSVKSGFGTYEMVDAHKALKAITDYHAQFQQQPAAHDQGDLLSIDSLLSEFKRQGFNIDSWDGEEGAEKAIVDGVVNHYAASTPSIHTHTDVSKSVADLNHVVINSCMNIYSRVTDRVVILEVDKIINAVKSFTLAQPTTAEAGESYEKELDELAKLKDYWYNRCYCAEKFIDESPCDPDTTTNQIEAFNNWKEASKPFIASK